MSCVSHHKKQVSWRHTLLWFVESFIIVEWKTSIWFWTSLQRAVFATNCSKGEFMPVVNWESKGSILHGELGTSHSFIAYEGFGIQQTGTWHSCVILDWGNEFHPSVGYAKRKCGLKAAVDMSSSYFLSITRTGYIIIMVLMIIVQGFIIV